MVPIGGVFLMVMGAAVALGARFPRWRMRSIAAGAVLGALAAASSSPQFLAPPPPTSIQLWSLAAAIAFEAIAFLALMPGLHRAGERAVAAGTLAMVGAHFAIMIPAFGILILVLALLCMLNGALLWRVERYTPRAAWLVDGLFKFLIGSAMLFARIPA